MLRHTNEFFFFICFYPVLQTVSYNLESRPFVVGFSSVYGWPFLVSLCSSFVGSLLLLVFCSSLWLPPPPSSVCCFTRCFQFGWLGLALALLLPSHLVWVCLYWFPSYSDAFLFTLLVYFCFLLFSQRLCFKYYTRNTVLRPLAFSKWL